MNAPFRPFWPVLLVIVAAEEDCLVHWMCRYSAKKIAKSPRWLAFFPVD